MSDLIMRKYTKQLSYERLTRAVTKALVVRVAPLTRMEGRFAEMKAEKDSM